MRHYLFRGAIAPLAFGMIVASATTVLISPAGFPQRAHSRQIRTFVRTVNVAAVAGRANEDSRPAFHPRANEESANRLGIHRLAPSSRSDMDKNVLQMDTEYASLALGMQGAALKKTSRFGSASCPPFCGKFLLPHRSYSRYSLESLVPKAQRLRGLG